MTPQQATDAHVAETLALAAGTPWGTHGVACSSAEEYAETVRGQAQAFLRPVDQYVGLSEQAAQDLAHSVSDHLCVHPVRGHRTYLSSRRVHVHVEDGVVAAARLDRPPWLAGVVPDPDW